MPPPFWINQWILENGTGLAYYQYNNSNLFGCTFRDQSRLLCLNQRTLVYNSIDRVNSNGSNFHCFDMKEVSSQSTDLRDKVRMLQAKRYLLATRRYPRFEGAHGQVSLDRKHLDRLPWLERRLQFKGNRRYLKANGFHLRMGAERHIFQLGYLYGGTGMNRTNRSRPRYFLLDTEHNSLTVQRHNDQMCAIGLDFVAAGNCTATMRKFVQYSLRYINALRNAERPRH